MKRSGYTSSKISTAAQRAVAFLGSSLIGIGCASAAPPAARAPLADAPRNAVATPIPPALESEVRSQLERRVASAEGSNANSIQIGLHPPGSAPQRVLVVAADSDGSGIQLLELRVEAGGVGKLSAIVARDLPPPDLQSPPPHLDFFYKELNRAETTRFLQRSLLAASAEVEADIALKSTDANRETQIIGARVWTADGRMIDRRFNGHPGNVAEPRRVPLALIREDLETLVATADRTGVNEPLRELIVDAWPQRGAMPDWARVRLLAVAAALPSRQLVALVRAELDGAGEARVRAINALAAATSVDLRRDATGAVRTEEDAAQAYKRLLTQN